MIQFERFILGNGLRVLVHEDRTTPLVAMNILYDVGSKDENPDKTGFAHLFEHLMFGGSVHIPKYDEPLENAGGQNNAFTTEDITSYYLTVPAQNIETGFWLESDRMLGLAFSDESLNVQRNVVIEEFRQRYLNQPYGDTWLLLRPHVFKVHPYRWDTIGMDISHIEKATMDDVKQFYAGYYHPGNAIMVIAGNTSAGHVKELAEKWFASIPPGKQVHRNLPAEPAQESIRTLSVTRDVPYDMIIKAYKICSRTHGDFYALDLITEILSAGNSSRFYNNLVKKKKLFSEIDAFLTGELDGGMFVISGKLVDGADIPAAEAGIREEITGMVSETALPEEMEKVKNKAEAAKIFREINVLNKAINLAYYELMGDAGMINREVEKYLALTADDIMKTGATYLKDENCCVLYYRTGKNHK
ncbi:MAG: insulinase family protein [Bacteroidetes bacterium]|nr:insulinase family protein [Bacteroidota bacterium]